MTDFAQTVITPEFIAAALAFLASFLGECLPAFQSGAAALKPAQKRMVMIVASFAAGAIAIIINHLLTAPSEPISFDLWYSLGLGVLATITNYGAHLVTNWPGSDKGVVKN